MKSKLLLLAFISLAFSAYAQETYVPDAIFENYLETHSLSGDIVALGDPTSMGNGIANDSYVTTSNINSVGVLYLSNLGISDLTGIADFTDLQVLYCDYNELTELDLTQNSALSSLNCSYNELTTLNLYYNYYLYFLECHNNQLITIDVRQSYNLTYLSCFNNEIIGLDLSSNMGLQTLYGYNNDLYSLKIKNFNNTSILNFDVTNNLNLSCIDVDDEDYSTANWTDIDATAVFSEDCDTLGLTYVPDDNFENYLETHTASGSTVNIGDPNSMGNGIANDDYVTTASIDTVTYLNIHTRNIVDLTGIEDFTALLRFYCFNNQITTLDLSSNLLLEYVYCYNNLITSINVTQNANLKLLNAGQNQLTTVDTSQNLLLEDLLVIMNQITSLDVTQNTNLTRLRCYTNQLAVIDITQNPNLISLSCSGNQLEAIDVSQNLSLLALICGDNQITSLDLSQNILLQSVLCEDNQLTSLNVKNGNNNNVLGTAFNAMNNPDLQCIEVDDVAYSTENWADIDATSTFVSNQAECTALSVSDLTQLDFSVYPNPTTHKITVSLSEEASYSLISVNGQVVEKGQLQMGESSLNIANISKGLYFLQVNTSERISTKKIIKN